MKKVLSLLLGIAILATFTFFAVASGDKDSEEETTQSAESVIEDDTKSDDLDAPDVEETTPKKTEKNESDSDSNELRSDFKKAMDSYENFMDEYVEFMNKYSENPSDINLLSDYADYLNDYNEFVSDFEKWESEEMNDAELAYYIDVQARVSKKLLEVSN